MVAIRPMDSCRTESSRAEVGEEEASPTPRPSRTAREESMPAIDEEKACSESLIWLAKSIFDSIPAHIYLVPITLISADTPPDMSM